jgi:hypothetical protein
LWQKITTDRALVIFIVLAAAASQLLFLPVPFINDPGDGRAYFELADYPARGDFTKFIDSHIYRTPAYPTFLALIKLVSGNHYYLAIMITKHLLGVIMCIIVYPVGREIFGK